MKFTSTTVAILSVMLAKTAFANFDYGVATYDDNHQDHAIWVRGEDPCHYSYLGPINENPCSFNGGWFSLDQVSYQLTGCGGPQFCAKSADGSGNYCAQFDYESQVAGPCYNDYGTFHVGKQWRFD